MSEYVLSLSYGKDSLACLGAIKQLCLPLDRIVHAEVWATDTIPADLPPMVEFKKKADKIIKERYGIAVEHYKADVTYEECFYKSVSEKVIMRREEKLFLNKGGRFCQGGLIGIWGFPSMLANWCNSQLKMAALKGCKTNGIQYIGIAADEPKRFHNLTEKTRSPLVEVGWTEEMCRKWCEENNLLSPIYTTATRGGCWFCHNQSVGQLRLLRKNYPEYWQLLLKWDADSSTSFKLDGHTVHDFDKRFELEDNGIINPNNAFKWKMVKGK